MDKKGIILVEPESPRLNYLKTPKPLILIYGKPLVMHTLESFFDIGIFDIEIIAPADLKDEIEKIANGVENRASISVISYPHGGFKPALSRALSESTHDHNFLVFCGLIFETNPLKLFSGKRQVEILLDKNLLHNKFAGGVYKAKTSLLGLRELGEHVDNYNAFLIRAYYARKEGVREIGKLLQANLDFSLEDAVSVFGKKTKVGVVHLPKSQWYEINAPETAIRAEMLLRRSHRGSRLSNVKVDSLKSVTSPLDFHYEKKQTTKVLVERGLIERLSEIELMEADSTASHHIIITDMTVDAIVGEKVLLQLAKGGYNVTKLVAPTGEAAKTMDVYREFAERIVGLGIDEHSIIFSLGGGAIANLAGFLAATLYRGIGLIHIPTTLMCMNDVAISLKQGINSQKGKNLVGSYYQPLLVLIDPGIPLNETIVRHGLSETIKHALAQDDIFFQYLLSYNGDICDKSFLETIIKKTIGLKIELMEEDMFENNRAIILQYGHEVGHALEFLSQFKLTHGDAISIGMRVSAEIAHLMEVTGVDTVEAHKKILKHFDLPYVIPDYLEKSAVLDSLRFNKKTRGSDIRFALVEFVGKIWKIKGEYGIPVPVAILDEALERSYKS